MKTNKKILIVCQSTYNKNTLKIAEAMARVLETKVVTPKACEKLDLLQYDVIGLGSGINFNRHNDVLLDFVDNLPKMSKKVFIFSTRANPFLGKYHQALRTKLLEKGFDIIGEFSSVAFDATGPFSIVGGVHKGRPHQRDMQRAEQFARSLGLGNDGTYKALEKKLKRVKSEEERKKLFQVDRKTHGSDWHGRLVCVDWNRCIGCGKCQRDCPLSVYDLVEVNSQKKALGKRDLDCVRCKLCKNQCPSYAIMLGGTWKDAFRIAVRHANKHK